MTYSPNHLFGGSLVLSKVKGWHLCLQKVDLATVGPQFHLGGPPNYVPS